MRPGMTVAERRSTTRAPGMEMKPLCTDSMVLPRITTLAFRSGVRPGSAISVPAWMTVTVSWATAGAVSVSAVAAAKIHFMGGPFSDCIDCVEQQADAAADKCPVDPDILKVAPDCAFEPVGDRPRVPAANRVADQLDDRAPIARRQAGDRAARELVDRGPDALVLLEALAH